jgi:hypothetical protein
MTARISDVLRLQEEVVRLQVEVANLRAQLANIGKDITQHVDDTFDKFKRGLTSDNEILSHLCH